MEKQPQSGSKKKIEEYVTRYFDKGELVESHNLSPDFEKLVKGAILDRHEKIKALMEHPKNIEYAKRLISGENIKLEELPENIGYAVRYLVQEISSLADTQKNEAVKDLEGLSIDELKEQIPEKYRDLPAEVLEDMWSEAIRTDDSTQGKAFQERKTYIIKYLKKAEQTQSDIDKIDEIRDRLMDSAIESVEKQESDVEGISLIPPQYKGLDSETLEAIWTIPEYVDTEKTKQEKEKKRQAIEALKKQESSK